MTYHPAAKHPLRNYPFLREDVSRLVLRSVEAGRIVPFDTVRAMPFRPALPMNRANLRCLGLSVGIAIALAGCNSAANQRRWADETRSRDAKWAYEETYRHCMYGATGPFGSASIEVMRECQRQAEEARRLVA